jgi:hypothetical protein
MHWQTNGFWDSQGMMIRIAWEALAPGPLDRIVGIHVVDQLGNILDNASYLQHRGDAIVHPGTTAELHLRPFQVAEFDRPKPMPIGDEDQGRVSMAMAAFTGDADKRFDLGGGQVLTGAQFAIGGPRT